MSRPYAFVFEWTLLNILARCLGVIVWIAFSLSPFVGELGLWLMLGLGVTMGISTGASQFLMVRRLARPLDWITVTCITWALGWGAGLCCLGVINGSWLAYTPDTLIEVVIDVVATLIVVSMAAGVVSALGQWLWLRRRVAYARWWLLAGPIEILALIGLSAVIRFSTGRLDFSWMVIAACCVWGIIYGVPTGFLLHWLFGLPKARPAPVPGECFSSGTTF